MRQSVGGILREDVKITPLDLIFLPVLITRVKRGIWHSSHFVIPLLVLIPSSDCTMGKKNSKLKPDTIERLTKATYCKSQYIFSLYSKARGTFLGCCLLFLAISITSHERGERILPALYLTWRWLISVIFPTWTIFGGKETSFHSLERLMSKCWETRTLRKEWKMAITLSSAYYPSTSCVLIATPKQGPYQ